MLEAPDEVETAEDISDIFAFLEHPPNDLPMDYEKQLAIEEMSSSQGNMLMNADDFEQPCEPVNVSGGTAAFYSALFKEGKATPVDKYIGKDFGRTADEFDFYMKMRVAALSDRCWHDFAKITFECPGVAHLLCDVPEKEKKKAADESTPTAAGVGSPFSPTPTMASAHENGNIETRALLLLENLNSGFKKMRLIDLKLGEQTAVAGFKGKSRMRAQVGAVVDSTTNSAAEGFRMEGIDSPPVSLEQYLQLNSKFVLNSTYAGVVLSEKRARRWCMQRLRGAEILNYLLTLQEEEDVAGPRRRRTETEADNARVTTKEQHAHSAIWQALDQVNEVVRTVLAIPVPQMWIGSSIGIMMETGEISNQPKVKVKVFDWGRSDMTFAGEYLRLKDGEKKERVSHWKMYLRSLIRVHFELLRLAAHRCCCRQWTAFVCELCVEQHGMSNNSGVGGDVACCGLYELPNTGPPLITRRVRLPLKIKGMQVPCATLTLMVKCRRLDTNQSRFIAEVRALENVANVVQQQRPDIEAVSVRVTAFEMKEDAKRYMQGWHEGTADGLHPIGKVFAQKTTPKTFEASTEGTGVSVEWKDNLEFMAFGDNYDDYQRKLTQASLAASEGNSSVMAQSMVHSLSTAENALLKLASHGKQTWPAHLPPTICSQKDVEVAFKAFNAAMAPQALEDGPWLPAWNLGGTGSQARL